MAKGYWIGRVDVTEPEAYQRYVRGNGPVLARYGGRFLVRGGSYEAVEGAARTRNVVIEFPSYEQALDCWRDADYQAVKRLRDGHCIADILVIEGYEGPQPS
jgi:uncharacterized protein (DUF1330 family)